jgi:ribosomal protein S27E
MPGPASCHWPNCWSNSRPPRRPAWWNDHFINLNCANCGAKLEVYDDMERFACGYCGTELIAQRRGGTVALRAVTEAIKKVQIGTDKTARGRKSVTGLQKFCANRLGLIWRARRSTDTFPNFGFEVKRAVCQGALFRHLKIGRTPPKNLGDSENQ